MDGIVAQWKRELTDLEKIEVNAYVIQEAKDGDSNHTIASVRPLVFGTRCGFGELHFSRAKTYELCKYS